jgi:hypothetical protein
MLDTVLAVCAAAWGVVMALSRIRPTVTNQARAPPQPLRDCSRGWSVTVVPGVGYPGWPGRMNLATAARASIGS